MTGIDVTGKLLNLDQLQDELATAGIAVPALGTSAGGETDPLMLFTYDAAGQPIDLPAGAQAVIDAHVAMRDKTDEEYATEFQNPATTAARRQEIRDITAGLLPREQVPVDPSVPHSAPVPPPPSAAHEAIAAAADLDALKGALLVAIP